MTNELTYRVLALLMLLSMKMIRWRTQKLCDQSGQREGYKKNRIDTAILYSMGVSWSLSVVVYALLPQWIEWAKLDMADWLRWIGVAFGLGSLALLAWSDHHLGENFSPTLRVREQHTLVQTGPYRWIRHPIYTSGMLFMMAMLLISSNWFVGLCWSGVIVLYAQRVPREEAMMLDEFGDEYRNYMNKTGRLLPKFGGFK